MAHAQKPVFVFQRNGRVHLNRPAGGVSSVDCWHSRGVRISGSNAAYTMFRGSVKGTGYPLHSPVSSFTSPPVRHRVPSHFNWTLLYWLPSPFASFPFTSPPVRHRVPSHFNWTLLYWLPTLFSSLPFNSPPVRHRVTSHFNWSLINTFYFPSRASPCATPSRFNWSIINTFYFPPVRYHVPSHFIWGLINTFYFPTRASLCAITFQLESNKCILWVGL